jgi:hypothetical protein
VRVAKGFLVHVSLHPTIFFVCCQIEKNVRSDACAMDKQRNMRTSGQVSQSTQRVDLAVIAAVVYVGTCSVCTVVAQGESAVVFVVRHILYL